MASDNSQIEHEEITDNSQKSHPISTVITSLVHKVYDINECATIFLPLAQERRKHLIGQIESKYDRVSGHLEDPNQLLKLSAIKGLREINREIPRLANSNITKALERSLYVNIFSVFDQFTGDLIKAVFEKKPELFNSINKEIRLSEALQYESLEELRMTVLDKEIETIKRKSYSEQFKDMEKIFSVSLTRFDEWPQFIENSQRRNLFTHCDGIVSEQYLQTCQGVGASVEKELVVGSQLEIGQDYFVDTCERITEVAVMLAQTIWRKVFPEEIEVSDTKLLELIFEFLHMEYWEPAIKLSEFATKLPNISSEQNNRINIINYAIALQGTGKKEDSIALLQQSDWSASTYDFQLAYAVLTEDYLESRRIMLLIGKEGVLINELAYLDWPLFKYFRESELFLGAYEEIFGYPYLTKAMAEVEKSTQDASATNVA